MEKRKFSIKEMFSKRTGKSNSKQDIDKSYERRENDIIKGRIYIRVNILIIIIYYY